MTKQRFILNTEQIEASGAAARARNPNKDQIEKLRKYRDSISAEILGMMSEEEKYYNLMAALCEDFDSEVAAIKCMDNIELSIHLYNLFVDHTHNKVDEAILDEVMNRLGFKPEDDIS